METKNFEGDRTPKQMEFPFYFDTSVYLKIPIKKDSFYNTI